MAASPKNVRAILVLYIPITGKVKKVNFYLKEFTFWGRVYFFTFFYFFLRKVLLFFTFFYFFVEHFMLDRGQDLLKIRQVQISKKNEKYKFLT